MKYLPHILLAYLALGIQRGAGDLLAVGRGRLDLVWIVALFVATCLPKTAAPIAAALIGLAYDLTGAGPLGWNAAALGISALVVQNLPANRWSRLAGAIAAGVVLTAITAGVLEGFRYLARGDSTGFGFGGMFGTILLTGLFALPLSFVLWKWRSVFVVEAPRF